MRPGGINRTIVSCHSSPVVRTGGFPSPNSSARDQAAVALAASAEPTPGAPPGATSDAAQLPRMRSGFWFLNEASTPPSGWVSTPMSLPPPAVQLKARKMVVHGVSDRRMIRKAVSELFDDQKPLKAQHIRKVKNEFGTEIRAVRPCTPTTTD